MCPTNLVNFLAMARKYPNKQPEMILRDLICSTPGAEGKWFAAAKDSVGADTERLLMVCHEIFGHALPVEPGIP